MEESRGIPDIDARQDLMSDAKSPVPTTEWDRLLRKYTFVWIWSVLLGSVTTVAFTFISYSGGRWGQLGIGLILFTVLGAVSVFASLNALGRFLSGYLLPIFFSDAAVEADDNLRAAHLLRNSFRYLIFAIIIRFTMAAVEHLLSAFSRNG